MWTVVFKYLDSQEEFECENYFYTEAAATDYLIELRKTFINNFGDMNRNYYPSRVEKINV
jgi:hypothetical protein